MSKISRLSRSHKDELDLLDGGGEKVFSIRFLLALTLIIAGIGWIIYYYWGVRPTDGWIDGMKVKDQDGSGPLAVQKLKDWNYLIGFGVTALGLIVAAHKSTPLGRGRGVVVGMLGCGLIGLAWICVYYVLLTGNEPKDVPIFNDLGQKNLFVGIGLMALAFSYATKWE